MDIHKPKAAHSWREFLIEIGTIICGILIALSLEQGLEWLREQRLASEAREGVRREIAADLGAIMRRREEQACIDHRLDELTSVLAAAREGRPFTTPQWVGRVLTVPISNRRWTAASQAGRIALLSGEDQDRFAQFYFLMEGFAARQDEERNSWATLRVIEGAKTLSPVMIWGLSDALARARMQNNTQKRNWTRANTLAQLLGVTPVALAHNADDLKQSPTCIPIDTERDTAIRMIGNSSGES